MKPYPHRQLWGGGQTAWVGSIKASTDFCTAWNPHKQIVELEPHLVWFPAPVPCSALRNKNKVVPGSCGDTTNLCNWIGFRWNCWSILAFKGLWEAKQEWMQLDLMIPRQVFSPWALANLPRVGSTIGDHVCSSWHGSKMFGTSTLLWSVCIIGQKVGSTQL